MKIAIVVSGGNVQDVFADTDDIEIELFDFDNEPTKDEPKREFYPVRLNYLKPKQWSSCQSPLPTLTPNGKDRAGP